jgi:hypothetical protein
MNLRKTMNFLEFGREGERNRYRLIRLCCERGFVGPLFLEIGSERVQGEIPIVFDLA